MSALDEKAVANGSQPRVAQSAAPPDGQILTGKQKSGLDELITDVLGEL